MAVFAKPVKVTFAVKADKAEEFRNTDHSKTLRKINEEVKKIKNITVDESLCGSKDYTLFCANSSEVL